MTFRTLAVAAAFAVVTSSFAFSTLGSKWGLGPNVATNLAGNEGTPGSFTWSIMAPGHGMTGFETHGGATTEDFGALIGGGTLAEEIGILSAVFDTWANASGLINLGMVADGNVAGGASQASGGHLGDIRVGLIDGMGGSVLAHAYQPGTEPWWGGAGGTILGDVHVNRDFTWVDDANEDGTTGTFDLFTVMLHEVGHSLGLGHSGINGSIMEPVYEGARRSLHADDLAGIQFIYGNQPVVPEPASMTALGLGLAWAARRRKRSKNS